MKHPFKLSKSNIVFSIIVSLIIIFLNIRIYGFDAYTFGLSFGSIIGAIIFPALIALLVWFIKGKKEYGGTTTFNIVLALMLLGSISEFGQVINERKKPMEDMQKAVSKYKERTLANPDSTDANYSELSNGIKNSIDGLLKTSVGEERKVYLALKEYFKKSDSVNVQWNSAYNAFAEPRILDFSLLNEMEEFKFQKNVIQKYIDESEYFKSFIINRVEFLKHKTKNIDKDNKAYKGFLKGMTNKDSIQKPIFIKYINGHIDYGKGMKSILELLEKENGKWQYENEVITFQDLETQNAYEKIFNHAILNEEIVNELSDKLVELL
ncbi:hypothetical protein [Snuella sedimenti]|uniref:Uncharacterized protein n=1 Tax=Snuella sedimenti TaxID=2798802 RepID=A0A8J7LSS6_9FLAO|nr:hypothetical protein [Snuella sedimenti]MBJ6367506.1 hypothetical protein [Snuella sedimenti]